MNVNTFNRWTLEQALTWIATGRETSAGASFDIEDYRQAWPRLASALASERIFGIGDRGIGIGDFAAPLRSDEFIGTRLRLGKLDTLVSKESSLRFPPHHNPGCVLNGVLLPGENGRIDIQISPYRWRNVTFLESDVQAVFAVSSDEGAPPRTGRAGLPSWREQLVSFMEELADSPAKVLQALGQIEYQVSRGRPTQKVMAEAVRAAFLRKRGNLQDLASVETIIRDYKEHLGRIFAAAFPPEK